MSEQDHHTEPHVSTDELRAALAPRADSRRNPVLVAEPAELAADEIASLRAALSEARAAAGELELSRRAIDAARADAIELRAALDAARGDAMELRGELTSVRADLRERRSALERLAAAGPFRRRRLLAEFSKSGLI